MFKQCSKIKEFKKAFYCTKVSNNKAYTNTVLLPKTNLPLRLENNKIIERDKYISNVCDFEHLYDWQRSHLSEPEFVLHDGPPYANGQLHMGHAVNKIFKDTILRFHILKGNKVHYIPGWDCHGLPIEMKAISNSNSLSDIDLRNKARNFASKTIEDQKKGFKAWGVLGDWKNSYQTSDIGYVKMQLKLFFKLYMKKLIYRDFKPVFWSPSSRTALAEAELEYNEAHKSPSLYLQFEIRDIPKLESVKGKHVYGLIWTTTPWTLPANCAVCYNDTMEYSLARKRDSDNIYVIASELLPRISEVLNWNLEVIERVKGHQLEGSTYTHPIYKDKICQFCSAAHVSATKGTGLVHTAPAHGPDDFLVSLSNKIPVVDLVDALGCYKQEAGKNLYGKMVLSEGNKAVINMLKDNLVHLDEITHSYPYDWRTKQPVIIRASQQWFINTEALKNEAMELLSAIEILPKDRSTIYRKNLISQIQKRPYWCISRQRKWGVPIPVFYNTQTQEVILNENTLSHHCNLLESKGTDFWWKLSTRALLPDCQSDIEEQNLEKGEDIMDIWLDSGLSWANVLEGRKVADLYLEGSDQFTGWFQSSLLTSVALRNKAPFKCIYVHGFAVDEKGNKMSKSLGNVIDPMEIISGKKGQKPYGIDVLRWWVVCHASHIPLAHVSANVLQACAEDIQKIRSVLRFAIGALCDYQESDEDKKSLQLIDQFTLHHLYIFQEQVEEYSKSYNFHKIGKSVINILTNQISGLYYTSIKDRLYCENVHSPSRRAAQYTLYNIFKAVSLAIAPILPHLVEEMYQYLPQKASKTYFSGHHQRLDSYWLNKDLENTMQDILNSKKDMNKIIEGRTLDMDITIKCPENSFKNMKTKASIEDWENQLVAIFQVAKVTLLEDKLLEKYQIDGLKTSNFSCPRCRRIQSEEENVLCKRCYEVVSLITENKSFVSN